MTGNLLTYSYRQMHFAGFIDRNFEAVAEETEALDGRIVPISVEKLASTALSLVKKDRRLVAVGESALDITQFWPGRLAIEKLPMRTIADNRTRELRRLEADATSVGLGPYCFIDDVAVSGLTLAVAREALEADDRSSAVVGMAMASRRLKKRAGMEVQGAITYKQVGGGRPAVNTLATFVEKPDMRRQYALAKFGDSRALDRVVKTYRNGE